MASSSHRRPIISVGTARPRLLDLHSASREAEGLFLAAACPELDLRGLLMALLQRAIDATDSDLGGAIFMLHPDTDELLCVVHAVRGVLDGDEHAFAQHWRTQRMTMSENRASENGAPENGDSFRLFQGGVSIARVPLLVSEHRAAMIQVESTRRGGYSKAAREALHELAAVGDILLHRALLRQHAARQGLDIHLVGVSPAFLQLERTLHLVARSASPVLISGERGSGKELAAYALHYFSNRRHHPFVALNSAALSETLFSDELFGHERGAYTGANQQRHGALLTARGGTLFLDEIGDMTPRVQAALLRFLESGELRKVGSDTPQRVDVRVIAATNKDLRSLVREGVFRADIVDRLDVLELQMPPLRERQEDLLLLVSYLMKRACTDTERRNRICDTSICARCVPGVSPPCVSEGLLDACRSHPFLGNVRELRNIITRLALLAPDDELSDAHMNAYLRLPAPAESAPADLSLDAAIRAHITNVLQREGQNKSAAARTLGLPLTTLINKMKRLGMFDAR
jgi:two-component system, NtrC family, response regulator HydG